MGSSNSTEQTEQNLISSSKGQAQQKRISQKKSILNSNGQKMREPDPSLLKKNSPPIVKIESKSVAKSDESIETIKLKQRSIVQKPQTKSSNTQNSINFRQNGSLYDPPNFTRTLWKFVLNHSMGQPQMSFQSFAELILSTIQESKLKFSKKIKKGEIYPVFASGQQSLDSTKDIQIFEIAVKNRVHKYFSVSKKHPNSSGVQNYKKQIKSAIQVLGNTIICQLMGKTSIWRSLMILQEEQQQKIMEMLEHQGIDQKHLREISKANIL